VKRGYRALLIDLPAHGKRPGKTTNLLEARDALLAVARQLGEPHAIIAHSFGAAVAAFAQKERLSTAALVFLAPLPSLDAGIREFAVRAKLPHSLVDKASRRIERSLNLARQATDLLMVAEQLRTPLLLIHDETDKTIPLSQSQRLHEAWQGSRLMVTEGLGHSRLLAAEEVTEAAASFVEKFEPTRGSELSEILDKGL
jgi:pimeloyl-ACP methyl ester carboxylesterase